MLQTAEDAIEEVWKRHGAGGLVRLLLDIAFRLPVEYAAEFRRDVRYGLRALAASPGFTAVALVSLTLGIGVASSAFSEMNGFVLRNVPAVARPGELVLIALGTVFGLLGAWAGMRVLSGFLAEVARVAGSGTSEPLIVVGCPVLLAALAMGACYVPARKSMGIDPAITLRQE